MSIITKTVASTFASNILGIIDLIQIYDPTTGAVLKTTTVSDVDPFFNLTINTGVSQRKLAIRKRSGDLVTEVGTVVYDLGKINDDGTVGGFTDAFFIDFAAAIFVETPSGQVVTVRPALTGLHPTTIVNNTSFTYMTSNFTGNKTIISPGSTVQPLLYLFNGLTNDLSAIVPDADDTDTTIFRYVVDQTGDLKLGSQVCARPPPPPAPYCATVVVLFDVGNNTVTINNKNVTTTFPVLIDNVSSKNVALVNSSTSDVVDVASLKPCNAVTINLSAGSYLIGNKNKAQTKYASFSVDSDGTVTKISGGTGDITIKVDGIKVIVKDRKRC